MGPARDLDNLVHTQYKPWEIEADTVTQEEMKLFLKKKKEKRGNEAVFVCLKNGSDKLTQT